MAQASVTRQKDSRLLRRLVGRMTFGLHPEEIRRAERLGYEEYMEYHLDYQAIDDQALESRLKRFKTLQKSPNEMVMMMEEGEDETPITDFFGATFLRSAYSKRQFYERMVEFWGDHFNIYFLDDEEILKPFHDREVIRKHALGRFSELLTANARSGAMLHYLDNTSNYVAAPNQNFARELVELHTLGPGHYTQGDIEELSRCFTGWTTHEDEDDEHFGAFRFAPYNHDYGTKMVLGHAMPSGRGMEDGQEVLDLLASDKVIAAKTARFLGGKLAQRFWGENPPEALVQQVADAYRESDGDIKAMIRVVLSREWLERASDKLKRPYHLAISALQAVPSDIRDTESFGEVLEIMGQLPFHWRAPDGYPDETEYWGGFALARWSFGAWFAEEDDVIRVDWDSLVDAPSVDVFLSNLGKHFFGGTLPAKERKVLTAFLAEDGEDPYTRREAVGLAIASLTFQWY